MSLLKFYNKKSKILILPYDFDEKLQNIPTETIIIYFDCGCLFYKKTLIQLKQTQH